MILKVYKIKKDLPGKEKGKNNASRGESERNSTKAPNDMVIGRNSRWFSCNKA